MIPLFSEEKVWYMYSTRMTDNIDLSKSYYLPDYRKSWSSDPQSGDPVSGTYSIVNVLGNFGVMGCEHKLHFEVQTDGRFVSQSDPSKYRDYYLAVRPKCRPKGSGDINYNLGSNGVDVNTTDRLENTKLTGMISWITPPVSESGSTVRVDKNGTMKTIDRFHCDLLLILEDLTSEELQHLSSANDYFTTFTIDWHCEENGCTNPLHSGHYEVVIKGYYGEDNPQYSLVSLFVKPTAMAKNLDILDTIRNNKSKEIIANLSFYCASKPGFNWKENVYVFLSASDSSKTSSNNGFQLVNKLTSKKIPYTLKVLHNGQEVGDFNGKDNSNNGIPAHYIDFTNAQSTLLDREGNTSYSIIFDGEVQIDFGDLTEAQITADLQNYGGIYTSDIYYYVVTSGNKYL